jgi:hypothetical protein
MSDTVLTRDTTSGRIHKRVQLDGRLLVDERDNLDDAGAYEVVTEADIEDLPVAVFCRHCFPELDAAADD